MQILTNKQNSGFTSAVKQNLKVRIMIINDYRAVLLKWEFFIKMRVAESQPSFDIEES